MSKSLWAAIFLLAGTMIHMPGAYAQTIGFADAIKILNSSCGEDIEKYCKSANIGNGRSWLATARHGQPWPTNGGQRPAMAGHADCNLR